VGSSAVELGSGDIGKSACQGLPLCKRVTVVDYPDGRLAIRYKGVELAYRTFDKLR
jgi:hypothetical protein